VLRSRASTEETGDQGRKVRQLGQGLASAQYFMGAWPAGSAKAALEAEEKKISIQKETRHIE